MRFAAIYGLGQVMGFSPQQVDQMSMWQFMATADGYAKANDPTGGKGLSPGEEDDLWSFISGSSH